MNNYTNPTGKTSKSIIRYYKEISCTVLLCIFIGTGAYSKTSRVDSLGLPGDNFDLYSALELFKKSSTPEEYEKALNSQNNGINNLDLNGDQQIDYIRVVDHSKDNSHSIVLQDMMSETEVQDIAVIGMDKINDQVHLQIVGDEALYGKNYVIEPSDAGTTAADPNTNYSQSNYNNTPPNHNSSDNDPLYDNSRTGNSTTNYTNNDYNTNNSNNYNNYNYNNYNSNYNNGYYNNSNGYNYNNNYYPPTVAVNVVAWPMVQYMYGPGYNVWVSPWRWNAYPVWWTPWRPIGFSAYYHRANVYHNNYYRNYYRPNSYPRAINAHQVYYPNRNYSPRYTNTSNVHYGPRPDRNQNFNQPNRGGGNGQNNFGGRSMGGNNGGGMRGNGGMGGGGRGMGGGGGRGGRR